MLLLVPRDVSKVVVVLNAVVVSRLVSNVVVNDVVVDRDVCVARVVSVLKVVVVDLDVA